MSIATGRPRHGVRRGRRSGDRLRDGQARQAGGRRGRRPLGRHDDPRDGRRPSRARPDADFFPLTVDVEERMYAAGKIPGGFFKREGRATERATLTARMIDRPIRPLWPKGFRQRGAGDLHRPLRRPRDAARHPLHQRRLGGADDLAAAVPGAGRRRARRPDRRRARPQPDARGSSRSRRSTSSSSAPRGADDGGGGRGPGPRGDDPPGARARARRDPTICDALEELRAQVGKPKWVDLELTAEIEATHGEAVRAAIAEHGLREAGAVVEELAGRARARRSDVDSPRRTSSAGRRSGRASRSILEKARLAAVEGPVREQFRTTCASSPTPSRTRRS